MPTQPLFTIIFGPTASGKTKLALQLAEEQNADILSYDSRHVYKGMDIVTGKDVSTSSQVQFFGIDLVEPSQEFSIRHFYEYAKAIIESHRQQNKPLILVGGSWPYAKVLIDPPASLFQPVNIQLREELALLYVKQLQEKLRSLDLARWESMNASDQSNPRRLQRAIEVAMLGDKGETAKPLIEKSEMKLIINDLPMETLEKNIRERIESRLTEGALEETRKLMEGYPNWNTPAFTATGYFYLRQHLRSQISLKEAKGKWFLEERQYAKRQQTWVKKLEHPVIGD